MRNSINSQKSQVTSHQRHSSLRGNSREKLSCHFRSNLKNLRGLLQLYHVYFLSFEKLRNDVGVGILFLFCLLFSSCFKEKPIKAPVILTNGVYTADMGENYTKQLYFNMQTGQFVDSNSKYDYDMAFDCGFTYNVWINGANLALVWRTTKTNIQDVTFADTVGTHWHEELGSGIPDSNAIGVWQNNLISNKTVYIINRGIDSNGHSLGFAKMQMGDFSTGTNSYTVTFCNMDNSNMHTVSVPKVANKNLVFLSFNGGGVVHDFEPVNTNWDFVFTQYSVWFGPPNNIPYKVTGVLTNPAQTYAYFMDSTSNFDSVTLKNINQSKFTTTRDNIGYSWKTYSFNTASYTVNNHYIFIIKTGNGQCYKMRFLLFYDQQGQKGYPEFQIFQLQ